MTAKATARRHLLRLRLKLDPQWVRDASARVLERLRQLPALEGRGAIGCYLARPREVQTSELIDWCRQAGRRVCVPARRGDGGYELGWYDRDAVLRPGPLGIAEPAEPVWAPREQVDVILAPLVGFDATGRRLGHGGGHFDRLLAGHRGPKVGLAFEYQRLAAVPVQPHDVTLDWIVTEAAVYGNGASSAE